MAEILREMVVALSLDSSTFSYFFLIIYYTATNIFCHLKKNLPCCGNYVNVIK